MAVRCKAWVCGHSLAGIVGSNPAENMGCLSVVSVVCCHVEVSASGRSLVQRYLPSVCVCVSECHLETSTIRTPRPPRGLSSHEKKCKWAGYLGGKRSFSI